jgi:hypothetical protein
MGWFRRSGKLYYRWSHRDGGKVRTDTYADDLGYGPGSGIARLVARRVRLHNQRVRMARELEQARDAWLRSVLDEIEALVARWADLAEAFTAEALTTAGYWRSERHFWRRRREGKSMSTATTEVSIPTGPPPDADLRALAQRANHGDDAACDELARLLKDDRDRFIEISCSDLSEIAQVGFTLKHSAKTKLHRVGMEMQFARLRDQIGGPHPSPLERLAADRVVWCWHHVYVLETALAFHTTLTAAHIELLERRRSRAQRDYLLALRSLAMLRRIQAPRAPTVAQVNITVGGAQQINT